MKQFQTRMVLMLAVVLVAALCGVGECAAAFPSRNVVISVPANAGGGGDIFARQTSEAIKANAGPLFVVENHPGGGGANAMSNVWGKKHDGHVLLLVTNSTIVCNPYAYTMPREVRDFKGVIRVMSDSTVLFASTASGIKTIDEFIERARSKKLTIGGYSFGSVDHIGAFMLGKAGGFEFNYIPYDSGADSIVAVMGGHIDAAFTQYSDLVSNHEAGTAVVLANAASERSNTLPDVPTFIEKGFDVPELANWRGYAVPKDVPDDVVAALHDIIKKAIETNVFKTYMTNSNLADAYLSPEEFTESIYEQYDTMGKVLDELGINK